MKTYLLKPDPRQHGEWLLHSTGAWTLNDLRADGLEGFHGYAEIREDDLGWHWNLVLPDGRTWAGLAESEEEAVRAQIARWNEVKP